MALEIYGSIVVIVGIIFSFFYGLAWISLQRDRIEFDGQILQFEKFKYEKLRETDKNE